MRCAVARLGASSTRHTTGGAKLSLRKLTPRRSRNGGLCFSPPQVRARRSTPRGARRVALARSRTARARRVACGREAQLGALPSSAQVPLRCARCRRVGGGEREPSSLERLRRAPRTPRRACTARARQARRDACRGVRAQRERDAACAGLDASAREMEGSLSLLCQPDGDVRICALEARLSSPLRGRGCCMSVRIGAVQALEHGEVRALEP